MNNLRSKQLPQALWPRTFWNLMVQSFDENLYSTLDIERKDNSQRDQSVESYHRRNVNPNITKFISLIGVYIMIGKKEPQVQGTNCSH